MKVRLVSRLVLPVCVLLCLFSDASGQNRYQVWHFGTRLGLDFKTDPPTVLTQGLDTALEGTSSISDCQTGDLLFYTNGVTVFNRLHQPMPNGTDLKSDLSSTQAALIVPDPGDGERYYLFTTDQSGYATDTFGNRLPHEGMFLHTIDMLGDNGQGAVIQRDIQLLSKCAEKLTGIWLSSSNTYWVIAHSLFGNEFNSWRVTATGYEGPIKSYVGINYTNELHSPGSLVASPDGTMLVSLSSNYDNSELYRFDTITGEVSYIALLPKVDNPYGAAFSPDNTKLYIAGSGEMFQFDVTAHDSASLLKSKYLLSKRAYGAIQQGPDERLYVRSMAGLPDVTIGIIMKPNESKQDCAYDSVGIVAADVGALRGTFGLPNIIPGLYQEVCAAPSARPIPQQELCVNGCIEFSDRTRNVTSWQWSFGGGLPSISDQSRVSVCYSTPGTYPVRLIVKNEIGSDTVTSTVTVLPCPKPVVALRDTTICVGKCIVFSDTSAISTSQQWAFEGGMPSLQTTRTTKPICYTAPGTFKTTLIASNQYGSDTAECFVNVVDCGNPVSAFLHDTLVCVGQQLLYTDNSLNATSWNWRFGSGTPSSSDKQSPGPITYTRAGTYQTRLIVGNSVEYDTSYSTITVWDCRAPIANIASHTICEGDSVMFSDLGTNYPDTWQWDFEGGTPSTSPSRAPGSIHYDKSGVYSARLIVSNAFGADTASSTIAVLSAAGSPSTSSISIQEILSSCSDFDTSLWIRSGCRELGYALLSPGSNDVTVVPASAVVPQDDSILVRIRISPSIPGQVNTAMQMQLNEDRVSVGLDYLVRTSDSLTIFPSEINFGETNICEERDSVVRLTNNGCDTLTITSADVDKNFSVDGSFPITLAPNESVDVPIVTIVDTTGKPSVLTGNLSFTSTADNQVAPIALTRGLSYPTKLRIEAVDNASGSAGAIVKFRIILEGDVPASMTALHFDFLHDNDLLSFEGLSSQDLRITSTTGNDKQVQSFTLSPVTQAGVLGELSFKTFMAEAEQTALSFSNIRFDARGVTFAPECIAVISDSGSTFSYDYTCSDNIIRDHMRGTLLIKSLTPNPAANEIRLELADGVGEAEVVIVDVLGAEHLRTPATERIDVSKLRTGTYYLRVHAMGMTQSRRVIIER